VSVSSSVSLPAPAERLSALLRSLTCVFVGPVGLEPTTYGLKVRSSAN
jgi:hypothetical protein